MKIQTVVGLGGKKTGDNVKVMLRGAITIGNMLLNKMSGCLPTDGRRMTYLLTLVSS